MTLKSKISTIEGEITANAGDWLCIGEAGEYWAQTEKGLLKKFNKLKENITKTVDLLRDGNKENFDDFCLFEPKPEDERLICNINHNFEVHASWGLLKGKKNDYLVKPAEDGLNPDPQDVWLVDKALFEATYEFQ